MKHPEVKSVNIFGFVEMLEEQLQEQHCEYTMLLVTKDIMDA